MAISVAATDLAVLAICIVAAGANPRLPQPPPGYKEPLKPSESREMQHRLRATTTRRPLTTTAAAVTDESPFTVHHVDEVLNDYSNMHLVVTLGFVDATFMDSLLIG